MDPPSSQMLNHFKDKSHDRNSISMSLAKQDPRAAMKLSMIDPLQLHHLDINCLYQHGF